MTWKSLFHSKLTQSITFESATYIVLIILKKDPILENMSDSLNICLACGLCCDGTLIGFVQISNDELPDIRKIMDVEEDNDNSFFLQPCQNYCEGCTIYAKRPKQCHNFNCGLLKSVERNELNVNTAIEMVNIVKQQKHSIEKKLALLDIELQSKSFYFKMVQLKTLLQKNEAESSLTATHLELISDLNQLDQVLIDNFGLSLK